MKTRTVKTGKRQPGWWQEPVTRKAFGTVPLKMSTGAKLFGLSFARYMNKLTFSMFFYLFVLFCFVFLVGTSEIVINASKLISL